MKKEKIAKIIIDTNFLFVPFYFKIDVLNEILFLIEGKKEIILPSAVIEELKRIKNSQLVFEYLKKYQNIIKIENVPGKDVDEAIINLIKKYKKEGNIVYVASGDKQLRKICKGLGAKLIYVRARKKLVVEE